MIDMKRSVDRRRSPGLIVAVLLLAALAMKMLPASAQEGLALPAPAIDLPASQAPSQVAVLAGGCFWGVQGVFQHVKGVSNARLRLCRRSQEHRDLRADQRGHDGARRVGAGHLRPAPGHLRTTAADLLRRRPRSDAAQSAGAGHRHAVSLDDLRGQR